jgi:polar amino acid transport system substrate-binding protein
MPSIRSTGSVTDWARRRRPRHPDDKGTSRRRRSRISAWHVATAFLSVVVVSPIVTVGILIHTGRGIGIAAAAAGAPSVVVVGLLLGQIRARSRDALHALHDPLTHLPNRALFHDRLAVALLNARRQRSHVAVVALDLNRFKAVNDTLGHAAGDRVLVAVSDRIRGAVRSIDTVARFGGDEFMVVLPMLRHPEEWKVVVERIIEAVGTPLEFEGHAITPATSAGVAVFPDDGDTADDLVTHADTALYRSKDLGGGRFIRFDTSITDDLARRRDLEQALARAMAHRELEIFYQPVIELRNGRITGVEALVRWHHPTLGLVHPQVFIPIAESIGLIGEIGEWVLDEASLQTLRWHEVGYESLRVAVNLSSCQFDQTHLQSVVARSLRRTGLEPSALDLEVSEQLAERDPVETIATLSELRRMGVRCTIDDFGTGSTGLSALLRLPIDTLKIDRSFVANLVRSRDDRAVVRAIIALGHSLDLTVNAEGVETAEQLELLAHLGCDHVQGFFFAAPLASHDLTELLAAERRSPEPWAGTATLPALVHREASSEP